MNRKQLTLRIAIAVLLLLPLAVTALQQPPHPVPPFQIFDNLYYVGIDWVSAYILKTSDGLIMIDTLYDEFTNDAVKGMQQLGLNPKDIKYVIVTHGHDDHAGGVKAIQALSGARVVMAEGDWTMTGLHRDIVVKDGQTITLGDATVKLYLTPGHTPGVTSLEFFVFDKGRRYKAFLFGGHGQNFSGAKTTETYIASVKRVISLAADADVPITNHPDAFQIVQRSALLKNRKEGDPNPYVRPDEFKTWLRQLLTNAEKKLAQEKEAGR
jgi:metallo-beta-lactamase class B